MFQNVINNKEQETENTYKRKINFKSLFKINDIILYTVSLLVSMVGFNEDFAPFGLAIFAAACCNRIPVGVVYVSVLVGTLIKFGMGGVYCYDFNI